MLQQEPLFKMQFSYICDRCHKSYVGKQKSTAFVCDRNGPEIQLCKKCVKEIVNSGAGAMHQGKLYAQGHPDTHCCYNCGKLCYSTATDGYWYCPRCEGGRYSYGTRVEYCPLCKKIHKKEGGLCAGDLKNELDKIRVDRHINFENHKENKSREPKGTVRYRDGFQEKLKELPFQEERNLPEDCVYDLDEFYSYEDGDEQAYHYITNYYFREPVEITGEIAYKRYQGLQKFAEKVKTIISSGGENITRGLKQSKYRNHFFKDISDDGLITWEYVDMMGNIKEKKESVNKFFEDNGMDLDKVALSKKVYYRLSSDLNHKIKSFRANSRLGSCQQDHNCKSYASGAYDAITNGCNCPILIFNDKEDMYVDPSVQLDNERPIGRITSRLMYDKNGKMYILIDRLYQDGSLSSDVLKGNIYKSIILDLKSKGYNVIVTNYSAHDESTLQYIKALGINNTEEVKDLYQPLRMLSDVEGEYGTCGYYSDGGIEVLGVKINNLERATDYLDKAYLII